MGVSVVYLPKSCIHHYYHGVSFFGKLKDQSCNAQNRRSGEIVSCLFETYKNYVMPHGNHMFQTESDMARAKMCAHP